MNLSPDEKETARQDYRDVSRRDFLKGSLAAGAVAGGGMGAFYFGYGKAHGEPVRTAILGTGDEGSVLLGAINPDYIRITALADIRPYNQHRAFHGDYDSPAALAARPGLMAKYGWKTDTEARKQVRVYADYRELLESEPDVEAVIIALPLHLHAPAAIAAMKAGKHVLTEKLMGHSVAECKEMARVAQQTHKHLATGHQRHYNILYADAVDTIQRGILGELHYIRAQWHRGNMPGTDSWQKAMPKAGKPDDVQADALIKELASWRRKRDEARGREIEFWAKKVAQKEAQIADELLKDSAKSEFGYEDKVLAGGGTEYHRPAIEELIRWRLWDRTGGGLMVELGSHQLDASSIFIAAVHGGVKQHPLNVMATSNRPIFPMDREADDHVCCIYEYAAPGYNPDHELDRRKKIGVQYASINGNGYGGYGEIVYGTKATLILDREQDVMLYRGPSTSKLKTSGGAGPTLDTQASGAVQQSAESTGPKNVSRGYAEELEHWAWCVRQNPDNSDPNIHPRCHPKVALADAVIALVTNIAARGDHPDPKMRGKVEFRDEWFEPESDETPEGVKPDTSRYA
jgi:predicted dehydrogenase